MWQSPHCIQHVFLVAVSENLWIIFEFGILWYPMVSRGVDYQPIACLKGFDPMKKLQANNKQTTVVRLVEQNAQKKMGLLNGGSFRQANFLNKKTWICLHCPEEIEHNPGF